MSGATSPMRTLPLDRGGKEGVRPPPGVESERLRAGAR